MTIMQINFCKLHSGGRIFDSILRRTLYVFFLYRSTQQAIYDETIRPLVASVLEGYNGCVFAYGQTGTGKTFTMEGKSLLIYAVRYLKS